MPAVELGPEAMLDLTKFMRVESTGTFGTGSAAVSRKVTYYAPIGYTRAEQAPKTKFHDKMQDLTNWQRGDDIGRIGTSTPGTSYGTTLKVDTAQVSNQAPGVNCLKFMEFQVGLNWSGAGIPIQQEWLRAGNYLSYDLEMKTFYTLDLPDGQACPRPDLPSRRQGECPRLHLRQGCSGLCRRLRQRRHPARVVLVRVPGLHADAAVLDESNMTRRNPVSSRRAEPCSSTPPTTIDEPPSLWQSDLCDLLQQE